MRVQLLSDLHIEFGDYEFLDANADVVVLAGDIHTKNSGLKWAVENIKNRPVIYVLGNHEFYSKAYPKLIDELKALAKGTNVYILEKDVVTIDGVNFLGCTLWTDFRLFGNPNVAGSYSQQIMRDYKKIRKSPSYSKINFTDIAQIHKNSKEWLARELKAREKEMNIVVTHHSPSPLSAPKTVKEDYILAAYVSDLEEFIKEYKPNYWLHGHLHNSSNYKIGSCQILSNPKGYPNQENRDFNPKFCFEVEG